jgi:hypothetical protein
VDTTVIASRCPPIHQVTFDLGAFALTGAPPPAWGVTDAYAPRRKVLDTRLVQEVLLDHDQVAGIRGHAKRGTPVTERARLIICVIGLASSGRMISPHLEIILAPQSQSAKAAGPLH